MTPSEIRESIRCNGDWLITGSVAKAQAFAFALQQYLLLSPTEREDEHNRLVFDLDQARKEYDRTINWLNRQQAGGKVRFLGVSNLRNQF